MPVGSDDQALLREPTAGESANIDATALRVALGALENIHSETDPLQQSLNALQEICNNNASPVDPALGQYLLELCAKTRKFQCVRASLARQLLVDLEESRLKQQHDELRAWLLDQIPVLNERLRCVMTANLSGMSARKSRRHILRGQRPPHPTE